MRFRTRAMLASGLLAVGLLAFAPHASAQEEGGEEEFTQEQIDEIIHEAELIAEQNGGTEFDGHCIADPHRGRLAPTTAKRRRARSSRRRTRSSGAASPSSLLLLLMWKFALPGHQGGHERPHRADPRRPRRGRDGQDRGRVGVLDGYKAQLADAKGEAGRIIEEARQAADALKRTRRRRLQTELAEARARAAADIEAAKAQATADLRGELAQLAVGAADGRGQQEPRPGRPDAAHRGLHQPGRARTDGRRAHRTPTRRRCSRSPVSEGALAEVEDELFRFARVLEGNDELRTTLTDQQLPVSRRQQIVEDLLGGKAHPITTTLVSMVVGAGRARDLPAIIDELVASSAPPRATRRSPRSARPSTSPTTRSSASPPPSSQATGKKVELKVDHRPDRARRARRPGGRHGDRRLGEVPPPAAPDRVLDPTTT